MMKTTHIKRGKRPEDNFTIVSNNIMCDLSISAEARLLLVYMISKPEDWTFRPADLKKQLGTKDKPAGKSKYDRVMKELREAGYLDYVTLRNKQGKVTGKQWVICQDSPNRLSEKPTVGKTNSRKIEPLNKTEVVNKTEKDIAPDKPDAPPTDKPKPKRKLKSNPHFDNIKAELDNRHKHYTPALIGKLIKAMKPHGVEAEHIADFFTWLDANKCGLVIEGKAWSWNAKNMSAYVVNWLDSERSKTEDKFGFNDPLYINHS